MTRDILEYRHARQGTISSYRLPPQGHEVMLTPDKQLDGNNYLFLDLANTLRQSPMVWKIYPDGRVYFVAPFGQKYGWILGEVARIYWLLQRTPSQILNDYREAQP